MTLNLTLYIQNIAINELYPVKISQKRGIICILTLNMTLNHLNNTINVFSSHNPIKRGITHAIALFGNNHIFANLTLKLTFDIKDNLESCK